MKDIKRQRAAGTFAMTGALVLLIVTMNAALAGAASTLPAQIERSLKASSFSAEAQGRIFAISGDAIRAGIPALDVEIIIDRAVQQKMDARMLETILDTATTVSRNKLPVRPILDRIQQGLAKGVSPERILLASGRLAEKLSAARPIVQAAVDQGLRPSGPTEEERTVESIARALEKGIPPKSIAMTGGIVKERSGPLSLFGRSVDAMTDFSENGMPMETAVRLIDRALNKGYEERDFARMERDLANQIAQGHSIPDIIADMEAHVGGSRTGQGYGSPDSGHKFAPAGGRGGGSTGGGAGRRR